jgi:iron(III) transport system substrate-binding protein
VITVAKRIGESRFGRRTLLWWAGGTVAAGALKRFGGQLGVVRATTTADVTRAKDEGRVVFYTSLDPKILESITKPFTAKYGINVDYYNADPPIITSKVLSEADAGRVQADIVDAADVGAFFAMKKRGVLRPYDSPVAKSIASRLRDPDNMWVADRLTQAVIQWNTAHADVPPPARWKDLTNAHYAGKLAYFSAPNGDGAPRLYTLALHFGWELLTQIANNKPLRAGGPQPLSQLIEAGERAIGFAQNDNIAWRSKTTGKPTNYVFPADGVPTELAAVGLIKDSAHPNSAALFYDWWLGDEGQKLLVQGGKYSSRSDFAPPKGSPPLSKLNLLVLDYAAYQAKRSEILGRMVQIFGGEWGG